MEFIEEIEEIEDIEEMNVCDNEQIHSIQDLNLQLTHEFDDLVTKYNRVSIKGEIIDCKMCKGILVQFVIKDGDNYMNKFKCKAWARNGIDLQRLISHENTTCIVSGCIKQNYWCGGRDFVLELDQDIQYDNENSKMKELKKECEMRGYFLDKKPIVWSSVKKIGLVSKKDTQGYNDFMKQFKMPIEVIVKEFVLEGENTEQSLISAINELQGVVDVILIIRGGGSTLDISSSFDRINIFAALKKSRVPVITAIGHEADKDDRLLITSISDYDYPTPTRAAIEMNKTFKVPYMQKVSNCLQLLENTFKNLIIEMKNDEYLKLRCLFDKVIKDKFGGRIIDIGTDDVLIIQKNGLYYKIDVDMDILIHQIQIKAEDIEKKNIIDLGIKNQDISVIEDNINAFVPNHMIHLINGSIKEIKNIQKLEEKFENVEPKKYRALYCKCVQLDKSDCNKLIQLYGMYLWYEDILVKLEDNTNIIKEIVEFLEV
jgi:exodeoxyribonuclease VII large subunit